MFATRAIVNDSQLGREEQHGVAKIVEAENSKSGKQNVENVIYLKIKNIFSKSGMQKAESRIPKIGGLNNKWALQTITVLLVPGS